MQCPKCNAENEGEENTCSFCGAAVVPKEPEINAGDEEKSLCTNCGTPNILREDFCTNCGCPLNSYAQIDPIKRIRTYGFIFRNIVKTSDRPLILIWGWIILAPPAICYYLIIGMGRYANFRELFYASLICIFCSRALFLLTRNYLIQRRQR